jgi:hypothetical protein
MGYVKENRVSLAASALAPSLFGGAGGLNMPGEDDEKYSGPLSDFKYDRKKYRPKRFADGGIAALARGGRAPPMDGRMLKGPGDGMSDSIPATISGRRPARLAHEEFVVPADVVSHLGNGSSDAGAKQLYAMMNRVREARTGTKKQGKQIKPEKYMPA